MTVLLRQTAQWQSMTSWLVHAALHSPDQRSTLAQGGMLALGGVHAQIGMPTNSACGAHVMGDGTMNKTSAGAHTHDDGAMHIESAGESDGTVDGHSGMHARIGMPGKGACGTQDGATHTQHGSMQIGMACAA